MYPALQQLEHRTPKKKLEHRSGPPPTIPLPPLLCSRQTAEDRQGRRCARLHFVFQLRLPARDALSSARCYWKQAHCHLLPGQLPSACPRASCVYAHIVSLFTDTPTASLRPLPTYNPHRLFNAHQPAHIERSQSMNECIWSSKRQSRAGHPMRFFCIYFCLLQVA